MSRLIDADALKEKAFGKRGGLIHTADIDEMPTIEERKDCTTCRYNGYEWYNEPCDSCTGRHYHWRPVMKTGKWIYNSPVTMKCDQCGIVIKDWDWHRFKICPGCGAKMER